MGTHNFDGVVFDLDGVITKTALVHAAAWKDCFDLYLKKRETQHNEPFKEFTYEGDYLTYVDGKPRYEGVKSFLESRGIELPYGDPSDGADLETICGIGNSKNDQFRQVLKTKGAEMYETTVAFIHALKEEGIHVGVASSSKNCRYVLEATELLPLFETRVDGEVSAELGLKGKPDGDIFVTAAKNMGVDPKRAVVVEDASSGVAAGRHGGFGFVLGVARENNMKELLDNGADVVVNDIGETSIAKIDQWFDEHQ